MKNCIIIPARLNSSRIHQKPLAKINGKELILMTYMNLLKYFDKKSIYITTDSQKVINVIKPYTKNYILFKKNFLNGAERCSYSIDKIKGFKYFTIVSCDMPLLNGKILKYLEKKFKVQKNIDCATIHTSLKNFKEAKNTSIAKIVVSKSNKILYISRNCIPSNFKKNISLRKIYSHHGLMIFKRKILSDYKKIKNTNLQLSEDNEWLKLLENDYKIKSFYVKKINSELKTGQDLKYLIKINK